MRLIKLLETENKILKDDIGTKQKLIDSLLQHNNLLLTQQERLTAQLLTPTSENRCKSRKKDVMQIENNTRQEEIPAKSGISKANKLPLKKNHLRVIQPIETKNCYSPLETEESLTENENTKSDSPNTKATGKQLLKTHKIQTIKLKVIHRTRGSSQLPSYLVIL